MKKAVSYIRVSSKEQAEGYSLEAQRDEIKKYAKRNKIQIIKEFEDKETAKHAGRTNFNKMVSFLNKNKTIAHILVEKTDRLYRNLKDRVIISEIEWLSIHLVKENEVLNQNSKSHQKLIHDIKLVLAKNYIDNLSEEITKGLNKKAESGQWPCRAPFGYRNDKASKGIIVNPPNSDYVRQIFEWYATGLYSLSDIVKKAKNELFINGLRKGISHNKFFYRILTNPAYFGALKWKGKTYPGTHEPIVSKELWDSVQLALERKNHGNETKRNFPFMGILTCQTCGCSITAEIKRGKYIYYHCTKYHGKDKCNNDYISQNLLDNYLAAIVKKVQLPADIAQWLLVAFKQDMEKIEQHNKLMQEQIRRRIAKLENLLDHVYLDKIDGKIDDEFWKRNSNKWQDELATLRFKLHEQPNSSRIIRKAESTIEQSKTLYSQYVTENWENKRKILKTLLSNCFYNRRNLEPVYKKPFDIFTEMATYGVTLS